MGDRTRTHEDAPAPDGDASARTGAGAGAPGGPAGDGATAFGGAALAMLARVLGTVATAAGVLLTAGTLSGADFGAYALATGIVGVIVVAADLGMTQSLMRAHAAGRSTRGLVLRAAAMRVAMTSGAGAAAALACSLTGADIATLVLAVTVLGVAQSISGMATGLLGAQRRPRLLAATTLARPLVELAGFALVAALAPSPLGFVLVSTAAAGLVAAVGGVASIRGTPATSQDAVSLGSVARYGRYLAVVTMMWSASLQVDQVVIAALHGAAAVATYAFLWKVLMVLAIGAISAAAVVAPWATDIAAPARLRAATFASWHRALVMASALLAACMAVAGPLVVALVNPDFRDDALLAAALAPALVMLGSASFTSACLGYLGARGRLRPAVELLATNLALDLLLVPWLGAWGAAIASNIVLVRWARAHLRLATGKLEELDPAGDAVDAAGGALVLGALTGAATVAASGAAATLLLRAACAPAAGVAVGAALAAAMMAAGWLAPSLRRLRSAPVRAGWLVLHFADYRASYPGTFIRQFEVLAAEVSRRGGRVALAVPHDAAGQPWAQELAAGDLLDLHVLPAAADRGLRRRVGAVLALLRELHPDVVQTHFSTYDVPTGLASMQLVLREGWRPRLAWYYRTTLEGDARRLGLRRRLKDRMRFRVVGAPVDVVTTISDGMAEQVARRGARRIEVVRGGCDTARFLPMDHTSAAAVAARRRTRERLGARDGDVLLLHMGWHWVLKGGDVLDDVVSAARGEVVQGGAEGRLVPRSVGMPEGAAATWVEPVAMTSDMRELLHAADVFMAVSRWEAFGNSLVEAMACGLVAVASDAPGHELTARGAAGVWMAEAGSAASTAAALDEALERRAEWSQLGLANRERVVQRFDITRWAAQLAAVHCRLAGAAGAGRESGDDDGAGRDG